MPRLAGLAAILTALLTVLGCADATPPGGARSSEAMAEPFAALPKPSSASNAADSEHGKELVEKFECRRCHDGIAGAAVVPSEKHCVRCHQDIRRGSFAAPPPKLAKWRARVEPHTDVPSLTAIGARFGAAWIEDYLLNPRDLRPHLVPTMPRLALSREQARDIAAYLTNDRRDLGGAAPARADRELGERLYRERGCGSCHAFTGSPVGTSEQAATELNRAKRLAPDLRHTRERFSPTALGVWVLNPTAVKPDTAMPDFGLSGNEASAIAAYVSSAELEPEPALAVPPRLPLLKRQVRHAEVDQRVFAVTCRHCHTDPSQAGGDGGPGNTGGFGFRPRRIDLSSHAGLMSGHVDERGERRSLFEPLADGTPRLVAALYARIREERGEINPDVRGMPLGLPSVSLEDIQLVETWISQGRAM